MKRKDHIIKSTVRVFPLLFWCDCQICKMQFRREWGWRVTLNNRLCFSHFCEECAPTKDIAEAAFINIFAKSPLAFSSASIAGSQFPAKDE